ncbi:hypothetical protein [Pseudosulfitobacter sp. SM2401]|uniref:hypothetical protein n=1 Tax=Pseudosulfitobacter sp. SM2401 TaxID=3350098 RepID=UPI0036F2BA4E
MTILHKGFDTIALSIKAALTPEFLDYLETEQTRAKADNASVLCRYGDVQFHLKHHGGTGYQFLLDGGPDGASWAFKRPHPKDPWGVRINIGSRHLALYGLGRAKAHVEDTLAAWGIRFQADDVSIARVDFCVDVFAPSFTLQPEHFVMHSGTGRRDYITDTDKAVNGKSGRTTSVTLGKMPNRQVIVYDKRAEVIARSKTYWWAIWNDTLRKQNLPPLRYVTVRRESGPDASPVTLPYVENADHFIDATQPDISRVWRVEFRAGKAYLKDTWGIRTWGQLFDLFGDLIQQTGETVRYTAPNNDPNRSRWPSHPIWDAIVAEMTDDLLEMHSGANPNPIKEVHKGTHISVLIRNILGTSISLAALNGVDIDGIGDFFDKTGNDLKCLALSNLTKTEKQLNDAKDRYVFLNGTKGTK